MPVTNTTSRADYLGNNVTTLFPFAFACFTAADVEVYEDGVQVTTGFTVTLNTPPDAGAVSNGGEVTYVTAPAAGVKLAIVRAVAYTQGIAYPTGADKFPAISHQNGLDRLTILTQQNLERLGRALTFGVASLFKDVAFPDLEAGKALRTTLDGLGLEFVDPSTAALGDFLQSGTGAVVRTAAAKMGEVVSVRDFGSAFDFATIRVAMAAVAAAGGGRLYIPKGTWVADAAGLPIPADTFEIFGDGDATILDVAAGLSFDANGVFSGTNRSHVYLHDLRIKGANTKDSTFNAAQKGTYFTGTTGVSYGNIVIERLHISGLAGEVLYADAGTGTGFSRVDFLYNTIHDCAFNALNHNTGLPVYSRVIGNHVERVGNALYEGPGNACIVAFNIGRTIDSHGILITNGNDPTAKVRCFVIGNRLTTGGASSSDSGIRCSGYGMVVALNEVTGWQGPGLHVTTDATSNRGERLLIANNSLHGNATDVTGGVRADLRLEGGTDLLVVGNLCEQEGTTVEGIRIEAAVVRAFVVGNMVVGGYTNPIVPESTTSVVTLNATGASSVGLQGVGGLSGTITEAKNLSGTATVSETATFVGVTFATAEPDANYRIIATVNATTGSPAADAFIPDINSKTAAGFNLGVRAAPGAGTSVTYHWLLVR